MSRLEEIKAREQEASTGPWRVRVEGIMSPSMSVWDNEPWKIAHLGKVLDGPNGENAEFIAHSREDIPYLLEQVEELEGELRNIERRNYVYFVMDERLKELEEENKQLRAAVLERDKLLDRMAESEAENERLRDSIGPSELWLIDRDLERDK